ncbi:hypothetical protein Psuf_013500 [Phytohabitans suffuscus]|uniref:Uncharacterized protein n=1 Tax=Phytohabitans suffuscus TaxID=624315 RepID=A0A6F8YDA0_9ACTN|nr:hypothetical protein Psuf_013500 [Phytohabitans suffuscus]
MLAGDDPLAVQLQAGQGARVRPGGQHDVATRVTGAVDLHGVRRDQATGALDIRDFGGLDQTLQALVELGDNAVLVCVDPRHVDPDELGLDAECVGFAGLVGDLAGVEEGLGGDAATVQAGAAELVLFDQNDR